MTDELAAFPARLASAARAAAGHAVPDGEWTPEEVVRHLVAVEVEVHQGRLADLATKTDPRWTWTEPGPWMGEPELGLEGVMERFAAARTLTLATLRDLDEADRTRVGHHETFGELDVAGLVRNAMEHDEEHLSDLARRSDG